MPTVNELDELLKRFHEKVPRHFLTKVDYTNAGIGQMLRYLANMPTPVSAGEIARHMNVSTARVAVLLKCMTEKGLIVKESDPLDARKSLVRLSEEGEKKVARVKQEHYELLAELADKIGMDRLNEFLQTLGEIQAVISRKFEQHNPSQEKGERND